MGRCASSLRYYAPLRRPLEPGIHVHARKGRTCVKDIDKTVRAVRLAEGRMPPSGVLLSGEVDAIYYMVSTIFGFEMRHIMCSYCDYSHLDKDGYRDRKHDGLACICISGISASVVESTLRIRFGSVGGRQDASKWSSFVRSGRYLLYGKHNIWLRNATHHVFLLRLFSS